MAATAWPNEGFNCYSDVDYVSPAMPVAVPVTTAGVLPAAAVLNWVDAPSVQVTLSATPGSLTMYALRGATTRPPSIYTGAIVINAQGRTDVSFWSTDGNGI